MTGKPTGLHHSQGFALVVTLSLMVLLTVIAIGLLSLSSTSLRSSASGEAQSQAVANARMAVTMALGELQKEAGDDRRITADASLSKSSTQSHLLWTWSLLQKKIFTQTVRETNKVILDGLCFTTMRIDSPKLQKQ
jgi:type II secretory pathway component PulK